MERVTRAGRWFCGGLALVVLVRLALIGAVELYGDEALYWLYAQHPAWCYASNPPLIGWLIWLTTRLGNNELLVRLGPSLLAAVIAVALYRWAARSVDRGAGLAANALLLVIPLFWQLGLLATVDVPLVLAWLLATWALDEAVSRDNPRGWLALGLALGLGLLSKLIIVLFGLVVLACIAIAPSARAALRRKEPYLGALALVVVSLPVWLWNLLHRFSTVTWRFAEHLGERDLGFVEGRLEFALTQLVVWSPVFLLVAVWAIGRDLHAGVRRQDSARLVRGLSAAVPAVFFAALAIAGKGVHAYWTAVAGPPAALSVVAFARERFAHRRARAQALFWALVAAPPVLTAVATATVMLGRAELLPLPTGVRGFLAEHMAYTPGERKLLAERVRSELANLPAGAFICAPDGFTTLALVAFYADAADHIEVLHPTGLARQLADWRSDRIGKDAVLVTSGAIGSFPLACFFESSQARTVFSPPGVAPGTQDVSVFICRGFRGFDTTVFTPVRGERANALAVALYRAVLGREPDPVGLAGTVAALGRGELAHLVWMMTQGPEFRHGRGLEPAEAQVIRVYHALCSRPPTVSEISDALATARWAGLSGVVLRLVTAAGTAPI